MSDEKSTKRTSKKPDVSAPISKVVQISASDLVSGTKLLYPGGKVIVVESATLYCPISEYYTSAADIELSQKLIVVKFVGQPQSSFLAFSPSELIYAYAD